MGGLMAEAERITINIAMVDVGKMDLLIDEGIYATRSDFVRASIRTQLGLHKTEVDETSTRRRFIVGTEEMTQGMLVDAIASNQQLHIRVIGVLTLTDDVMPEIAAAAIQSISVYGSLRMKDEVRQALGDRILR
jgi:Arc/MetJ-type ribon-helix-helix transcriptional regulator